MEDVNEMAAENEKKKGFFSRVAKYFRETKAEMKKVSWPTRSKLLNNTLVVIAMIIIVAVLIFVLDKFFEWGLDSLIQVLGGTV